MNKKLIIIFSGFFILTGNVFAEEAVVETSPRCSTVVVNDTTTKQLIVATTTCPSSEKYAGTVTKVYPNGKTIVLQNGQIVTLE